jgi:diaminopimelate epimerase
VKARVDALFAKGGELHVSWEKSDVGFKNIYLIGPAQKVYEGAIKI